MRIFRNPLEAGRALPGAVVTIGKFDAVHRGHQRVIRFALEKADALGKPCVVLSFDPSADQFLRLFPRQPLLTIAERVEVLAALGVDGLVLLPFDKELACLTPEAFARDVLAAQLKPAAVCVGEDFCFGKDRSGRLETLGDLGARLGFAVHPVPLLSSGGEKVSATRIRRLLEEGDRQEAENLLGRPLPPRR